MTRKIATFFVLCLFLATLPALGAQGVMKQKDDGLTYHHQAVAENASNQLRMAGPSEDFTSKYTPAGTAMGYDAAYDFIGYQVGRTFYDYQHNGTMGRQVAVGSDARVHMAWMYQPSNPGTRGVNYNSMKQNILGNWIFSEDTTSGGAVVGSGAGYSNLGLWDNKAVVCYHLTDAGDNVYKSWVTPDNGSGSGDFLPPRAAPDSACDATPNGYNDGEYIWPIMDVESHGGGSFTVHMVSSEYDTSAFGSIVYYRATGTTFADGMFGECGIFIDSTSSASATVVADRNSDKVAVVYGKDKWDGGDPDPFMAFASRLYNDVAYRESSNDGVSFGPVVKVTNYPDVDSVDEAGTHHSLFAISDYTALYDASSVLHIVWMAGICWPDEAGAETIWYYPSPGDLYHWHQPPDSATTLVVSGRNIHNCGGEGPVTGRFNRNVTKPNLVECSNGNLYVTYTYFWGDANANPSTDDCSTGGYANGDLYAQASATDGLTWGPPENLTKSATPDCAAGDCASEHWASSARYADSLYILFVGDRDPGGWAGGAGAFEGTAQDDPMQMLIYPCFDMETYVTIAVSDSSFLDPFHRAPSQAYDTTFVITNFGNADANYTIAENPTVGWLAANPVSGSIPPAINNKATVHLQGTAPASEGLYQTNVEISFNDTKGLLSIPVDFYVANNFFIPENATIRTSTNRLNVQQVTRVGDQESGAQMSWFADNKDFLYDGSLIVGYDANNLFTNIFYQLGDTVADDNPLRELRALSSTTYDSTSFPYRYATGTGCTADSLVGFRSQFYASKHPDSADFYVAQFDVYAGPNQPEGDPITGLVIGYATDWDIPSDSGSDNYGHVDSAMQMVYQQGGWNPSPDDYQFMYGGIAYRGSDSTNMNARGGFFWQNAYYVYPDPETNISGGYHADSLWKYLPNQTTWGSIPVDWNVEDSIDDLNCIIAIDNNATLTWTEDPPGVFTPDEMTFYVIFAGSNDGVAKSDAGIKLAVKKAERFICDYLNSDAPFCVLPCKCGDADNNNIWNIADAVYLIGFIFGGGSAPDRKCLGDADGNNIINIADAVYLIGFIFGGGNAPAGCIPD